MGAENGKAGVTAGEYDKKDIFTNFHHRIVCLLNNSPGKLQWIVINI